MRRRLTLWGLVAALALGAACGQASMSRNDARVFAREALIHIGFTGVRVSPTVTSATYRSPDRRFRDREPVKVWRTHGTVSTGTVDLYVPKNGNSAVFVRDEASAGGPLLTDRQFKSLQTFRLNPAQRRRRHRLEGPTVAAVVLAVVVATGLFLAYVLGATERRLPSPDAEAEPEPEPEPEPVT